MTGDQSRRSIWPSPYVLLTLTALFWAGNSVVGRALHDSVPPVTLAFWRWSIALAVLLPWVVPPLARQWRELLAHWKVMLLLSALGIGTYNALLYTALHTTTATNSLLINSACPVMIITANLNACSPSTSPAQRSSSLVSISPPRPGRRR